MAKKTKKKKKSGVNPSDLKQYIKDFLKENKDQSFSIKQVIKNLGFRDKRTKDLVKSVVFELEDRGQLQTDSHGKFSLTSGKSIPRNQVEGAVDHVNSKYAYIVASQEEVDVYVKTENLNGALDGDIVKVKIFRSRGGRPEGEVTEVIRRKREELVGRIEVSPHFAFVVPDNRKIHNDIYIRPQHLKGATSRDKVIVKILEWPVGDKKAEGEVTMILGKAGENEAEIHSIMAEFGLPFSFPQNVITQAKRVSDGITSEEIKRRRDFRGITTFTIDPADAKDFDDAISVKELDNGYLEIGVHIADVTHYVKPGTILDKAGFERATSVYLVDRTVPMLPERLSNELCSLRPDEDKLTFSAVFELDEEARVVNEWFGKTVIRSIRRFSYEEAQERIESVQGDFARELTMLNQLALKLRLDRFRKGAINFETVEVKFELDEKSKPVGIIPKIRKDAHKLIEEFMLLANKRVAEFVHNQKPGKHKNTFVYRVHANPDPEKLSAFAVFARKFGHKLQLNEENISRSLNSLIDDIEGKPEQNVLQNLAIRTMAKAVYTTDEVGHFGLAFPHYTHFTSPIRRYPDMMSHRLLFHYLNGGKTVSKEEYEQKCEHSSEMERRAVEAERASIKYKQVEFMESVKDQEFNGIISGVTEWGLFVDIVETRCEGMIRISELTDDYYEHDEKNFRVIGKRNKKIFTLGDDVKVKVIKTDIDRRTIDLELVQ